MEDITGIYIHLKIFTFYSDVNNNYEDMINS